MEAHKDRGVQEKGHNQRGEQDAAKQGTMREQERIPQVDDDFNERQYGHGEREPAQAPGSLGRVLVGAPLLERRRRDNGHKSCRVRD